MWKKILIFFFISLFLAFLTIPDEPEPTTTDTGIRVDSLEGDIVFMSKAHTLEGELYLMNTTGHITRLTNNSRHENNPAFSFDRKKIAFHGGLESNPLTWEIFILDLETGLETQMTNNNILDGHPDWSPDGTKLVYASFQDLKGNPAGVADIFVMDVKTKKITRITTSLGEDNDPEWSPDGTKIIIKSTRRTQEGQKEEIYSIDADGRNPVQLTMLEGFQSDHDASWAPDSKSVVFERFEGDVPWTMIANISYFIDNYDTLVPWNIYSVDLGGNVKRLSNSEHIAFLPVYSPDGSQIMYILMEPVIIQDQLLGMYKWLVLTDVNGTEHTKLVGDDWEHIFELQYFDW